MPTKKTREKLQRFSRYFGIGHDFAPLLVVFQELFSYGAKKTKTLEPQSSEKQKRGEKNKIKKLFIRRWTWMVADKFLPPFQMETFA